MDKYSDSFGVNYFNARNAALDFDNDILTFIDDHGFELAVNFEVGFFRIFKDNAMFGLNLLCSQFDLFSLEVN